MGQRLLQARTVSNCLVCCVLKQEFNAGDQDASVLQLQLWIHMKRQCVQLLQPYNIVVALAVNSQAKDLSKRGLGAGSRNTENGSAHLPRDVDPIPQSDSASKQCSCEAYDQQELR